MPVCNFFLQGRCRYGDKCWNEHPRGGRGGGGGGGYSNNSNYNRSSQQQQQPRGGGGFGNRVWVNPSQQKGRSYIQPSSFSGHDNDDWGRGGGADWGRGGGGDWGRGGGGGGGADWGRSGGGGGGGGDWGRGGGGGGGGADWSRGGGGGSDWGRGGGGGGGGGGGSSSSSGRRDNRFSVLNSPSTFDKGGRGGTTTGDDDDEKKVEVIQADMEIWENSGQWGFSCYSCTKALISGFSDLSPEELRLEYYTSSASGDLQNYINGVNQLLNQWRNRIQELKLMNPTTRVALITELSNPTPQGSSGEFGGSASNTFGFGHKDFGAPAPVQASGFTFGPPSSGFGSSDTPSAPGGFGSSSAVSAQPPSGFGSSSSNSVSAFSFAASNASKPPTTSASEFSFSMTTGGGFGTGFGTVAAAASGGSGVSGQTSGGFGSTPVASTSGTSDSLFSTESSLTPEELNQFKAKRFTLGQIPLKPPPANMLIV